MRVLVIVPAFNESENIRAVVASIRSAATELTQDTIDIAVVNDGSVDQTAAVARDAGAYVLDLPFNLGIGGAVQTGFKFAHDLKYDAAVQIDGDGQHDPKYLGAVLEPLRSGSADVVIGSRFMQNNGGFRSTSMRRMGIRIFRWVNSMILRQRMTDNTSGFRSYNHTALAVVAEHYPTDYPEPESAVMLGKAGFRIVEVPVRMRERQGGQSSITFWRSGYYMIKVLLAILMSALRKPVITNQESGHGHIG
jgi:glycosyltransferase involved in cell wall biosynthesis